MNLTFLAHDADGNMRLIKCTTVSDTPDVEQEWNKAIEQWKQKVPLLGQLSLVGALAVNADLRVQWYPDMDNNVPIDFTTDLSSEGWTLH